LLADETDQPKKLVRSKQNLNQEVKMMKKNKTYHLVLNKPLTLTLTPPNQRGNCFKCHLKKEIYIISENYYPYEEKNFCQPCALFNLDELEQSDYEFENKTQIIKEIRQALEKSETLLPPEKESLLECYG
jgi:hypothetical protein